MLATWTNVLTYLPPEYKSNLDLFDPMITEETPDLEGKTKNFFLIHRKDLFSTEGYAGINETGTTMSRTWMRWHYNSEKNVDGILFTHATEVKFHTWVSQELVSDGNHYTITCRKTIPTTYRQRIEGAADDAFSSLLRDFLTHHNRDENPTAFDFEDYELTSEDEAMIQGVFGNSRPGLPLSLQQKLYPMNPMNPLYLLAGSATLIGLFVLAHRVLCPSASSKK